MESHAPSSFSWISTARDTARAADRNLRLGNLPILEAWSRFNEEGLHGMTLFFYSRGDAGTVPQYEFNALVEEVAGELTELFGFEAVDAERARGGAVGTDSVEWVTPLARYSLEWSFRRAVRSRDIPFRAEFVRLNILPAEEEQDWFANQLQQAGGGVSEEGVSRREVVRENNGDVYLPYVPMVDQGARGYCVVATIERVLRYYDVEADQHELAQLADATPDEGTNPQVMMESLRRLAARFRLRTRTHFDLDVADVQRMLSDYNRSSRRHREIDEVHIQGQVIYLAGLYAQMDPDLFREIRNRRRAEAGRFERTVRQFIDRDVPVVWSVMLGVMPEPTPLPQTVGGHMRLIIGYNEQTEEILFSDSWGRGHEVKRMPIEDAWPMTVGLHTIEPL